jgi:hypothetical protein
LQPSEVWPDDATLSHTTHVLCLPDGLQIAALENGEGFSLRSYKIRVREDGPYSTRYVRREPTASFSTLRFATMAELIEALRHEIAEHRRVDHTVAHPRFQRMS